MTSKLYAEANSLWPSPIPRITPQEAVRAAKALYVVATGHRFGGVVRVTGRKRMRHVTVGFYRKSNFAKAERAIFVQSCNVSWDFFIHSLSHDVHKMIVPNRRSHDWTHASLEKRMVEAVISRGWTDGRLKRNQRSKAGKTMTRQQANAMRVDDLLAAWEKKLKRATNKVKTLKRRKARYDKLRKDGKL
jgi:hypothetical protein